MRAHRRQDISIGFGKIYNSPCQGAKGLLVALQAITDCLSIFCFFLDIKNWRSVAGPAPKVWRLEKYSSSVLSQERARGLGASSGSDHC